MSDWRLVWMNWRYVFLHCPECYLDARRSKASVWTNQQNAKGSNMSLQPLRGRLGSMWVPSGSPIPTTRCTCPMLLGMEKRTAPPQTRGGTTTISGGTGLPMRTGGSLASPPRTMKAYCTQDAPGADEATRVGSPSPCVDNHRLCPCPRHRTGHANWRWNDDESWTRWDAVTLWSGADYGRTEPVAVTVGMDSLPMHTWYVGQACLFSLTVI